MKNDNKIDIKSKLQDLKNQLITQPIIIEPVKELETTLLEPRQRLFIDEYLKDFNGTQAAIRAGYSEKTAQEQSSRLLSKVIVKEEITRRQTIIQKTTDLSIIKATQDLYRFIDELYNDEKIDRSAQLKAFIEIFKLNGLYTTKVDISSNGEPININFNLNNNKD